MKKQNKLLLLAFIFFILNIIVSMRINYKFGAINLMAKFEIYNSSLLFFLVACLIPALIPAFIVNKIKKDSKKKLIGIKLTLIIIYFIFYYFAMNIILMPPFE